MTNAATRRLAMLATLGLLVGVGEARAAGSPSRLTLLFTGDNGGELAPCG